MKPKSYTIKKIVKESSSTNSYVLDGDLEASAGQFYMVWVKGVDEIPISPSAMEPGKLTVRAVGEATEKMSNLEVGDSVGLRGAFGSSFSIKKQESERVLVIAGGVGAAPILPLCHELSKKGKDLVIALGAITEEELLFKDKFNELGKTIFATEDGSFGHHGYITRPLKNYEFDEFDSIYSCGPEPMMYKIFNRVRDKDVFAEFSLHRFIKCGVGLCGSCCIDPSGLRVCEEGPIFEKKELEGTEFGEYKRDESGKKISLLE